MSMIGCYRRVKPSELRRLQAAPDGIEDFINPPDYEEACFEAMRNGQPPPESPNLDVDKAWMPINFLLCGETVGVGKPPLGIIVCGGRELGDVDLGYGPARYLTADEVRAAAHALEVIPAEKLMERFDYQAMVQSGACWLPENADEAERKFREDEERDYVPFNYTALRRYFLDAARAGDAMLLWIS